MSSKNEVKQIQSDIKDIRENHLGHIRVELEGLKTDIVWVKKFFFIVASSAIGSLATGLLNLFK